ncbi:hypothetical protein [Paraburkholderia terrae]|uniref:hypothetical protein n=1 Tax=Paraburkholderia terrae TaxID=311230 RepID=UPI001EE209ED|nr:hypothetical protein [Paraburkholderia terrae]GJH04626.1 hypothetical protein CBA19C8_28735 [Paraburkholderia terrae]
MKKTLCASLVALTLVACASTNVSTADAPEIPNDHVIDKSLTNVSAGTLPVTFKRDTFGPAHALYRVKVFVDGRAVANIGSGEKLTTHLPAGRHVFGVGRSNSSVPEREIAVTVSEQYQPVLRLSLVADGWGGWKITESSF